MTANRAEIVSQLSALGIAAKPNTNTKHLVAALERAQYAAAWQDAIETDARIDAAMAQLAADERARVEREHVDAIRLDARFDGATVVAKRRGGVVYFDVKLDDYQVIATNAGAEAAAAQREKRADAARRAWVTIRANRARAAGAAAGKSHRDLYPEQYTHALVGKVVEVDGNLPGQILSSGRVTRVVTTRLGSLVTLEGNDEQAWALPRCREIATAAAPEIPNVVGSLRSWLESRDAQVNA